MLRPFSRALVVALLGATLGALAVELAYRRSPAIVLEMDRDLPRVTSGVFPVERAGDETFAWTTHRMDVRLPGLDRDVPWTCTARLRGGRPAPLPLPRVGLAVDGLTLLERTATNDFEEFAVTAPAQPSRPGLTVSITSEPTFVPGPGDPRALGVMLDRVGCAPADATPDAPREALATGAMAGALLGGAFALAGLSLSVATLLTLGVAFVQAVAIASPPGPYSPYLSRVAGLSADVALATLAAVAVARGVKRQALSPTATLAIAISGAFLFVELAGLLHPAKLLVDAVFHAHRLEWVLGGRYLFTQPMPDGVRFPYAIALYVFSAPFASMTPDRVLLLRLVVLAARAVSGVLLYSLAVREWRDGRAGVLAVVLFHLAPLPFIIIGNANLTFAFAQSTALVATVVAARWPARATDVPGLLFLVACAAAAFLGHVGIFPLLFATLACASVLLWLFGGRSQRGAAAAVLVAAVLAAAVSVVVYYGRFGEAYASFDRVRSRAAAVVSGGAPEQPLPTPAPDAATGQQGPNPRPVRALKGLSNSIAAIGWPMACLAVVGAWTMRRRGARDRVSLVVAAVFVAFLALLAFSVVAPVEARFERYSYELIDRLAYATMPAVALVAARGASAMWDRGRTARSLALVLLAAAGVVCARQALTWLE